jgi:hypothetical protein
VSTGLSALFSASLFVPNRSIRVQNKRTLSYVTDLSTWTMQHEKAHLFGTGIEALFFCFNRHLKNMQILGEFVNPRLNFTMPVTDLRGG